MSKIAFLHSSSILGGSEKSFLDLAQNLDTRMSSQCIFVLPEFGPLYDEIIKTIPTTQCYIIRWPKFFVKTTRKYPFLSYLFTLLSLPQILFLIIQIQYIFKKNNISILYSNGIKSHLLSLIYKLLGKYKLIWHMQDYFPNLMIVKLFLRLIRIEPEEIISNSESVSHTLQEQYNFPNTTFSVIHNAVNPNIFLPPPSRNNSTLVISIVGMLTPWKGQDVFIEAIRLLLKENPNLALSCQIIGDEVYQTSGEVGFKTLLTQQVSKFNLQKTITFLGLRQDVEEIYKKSDIVVHCSKKPEPFGRVIIEAMSCECAVIAANAGGVREIVSNMNNGLLVEPNSPDALKQALQQLIFHPEIRLQLAKNGRATVLSKFSSNVFAQKIQKVLESVA